MLYEGCKKSLQGSEADRPWGWLVTLSGTEIKITWSCSFTLLTSPRRGVKLCALTLNLLTTTIVASPSNASKWQMGFNSAFKGLMGLSYIHMKIKFLLAGIHTVNTISRFWASSVHYPSLKHTLQKVRSTRSSRASCCSSRSVMLPADK